MRLKHTGAIASWTRDNSQWSGLVTEDDHHNVAVDVETRSEVEVRLGARGWERTRLPHLCLEADEHGWWYVVRSIRDDAERVARRMTRHLASASAHRRELIDAGTDVEFLLRVAKGYRPDESSFLKHVAARVGYQVRSAQRRDRNRMRLFDVFRGRQVVAHKPGSQSGPEERVIDADAVRRARETLGEEDWEWILTYVGDTETAPRTAKDRARAYRLRTRLVEEDDE